MNLMDVMIARMSGGVESGSSLSQSAEQTVAVSGTSPAIAAADSTVYICTSSLTSLTVSSLPATGLFGIVFASGSTAPELILPANIILPYGVSIETNVIYEFSVRVCAVDGQTVGLAAIQGWQEPAAAEEEST